MVNGIVFVCSLPREVNCSSMFVCSLPARERLMVNGIVIINFSFMFVLMLARLPDHGHILLIIIGLTISSLCKRISSSGPDEIELGGRHSFWNGC
mmetsp:Transcript_12470/g.30487  ORF Transcript_12470/g.30487 Transcript_12470/m.30487 type:complete len:95 (+) Transcript_12470:1177-1461(+)